MNKDYMDGEFRILDDENKRQSGSQNRPDTVTSGQRPVRQNRPDAGQPRTGGQNRPGARTSGQRSGQAGPVRKGKNLSRPKKKRSSCLGTVIRFLLILLFLFALAAAFLFGFCRQALSKLENKELDMSQIVVNTKDEHMDQYTNIALFGVDDQDNVIHDRGSRSDSIIVASINNRTRDVKLMSIYRDTYVSIDGQYDKINAAYSYGGPELAISTINRNLDLNITDFATINFKALADAVDTVGGITLTIESDTELKNLNDYIGNMNKINGGHSKKFKKTGTYTFDGNQAVAYSRIRYMAGGDHARANHQRLVIAGIVKEIKKKPWTIGSLLDTVLPQCKTSLSASEMTKLGMALPFYSIKDSQAYPFDSVDERYNGIYYGFALSVYSNVQKAHAYLFDTEDYTPTDELGRISDKVKVVTEAIGY